MMNVEKMPSLFFNSTAQHGTNPNQALPPTHPPSTRLDNSQIRSVSATCAMIGSFRGKLEALGISIVSLSLCSADHCTTSCVTIMPAVASAPFLNIVPSGLGFLGSNVKFGNPPNLVVFGRHADMDSSINKYTVFVRSLHLWLNACTKGKKEAIPWHTTHKCTKVVLWYELAIIRWLLEAIWCRAPQVFNTMLNFKSCCNYQWYTHLQAAETRNEQSDKLTLRTNEGTSCSSCFYELSRYTSSVIPLRHTPGREDIIIVSRSICSSPWLRK